MKIGIVNLITKTVDMPDKRTSIIGLSPSQMISDKEANILQLGSKISSMGHEVTIFISDAYEPVEPSNLSDGRTRVKYLETKLGKVFPPAYIPFTPALADEISSTDFDVVQSGEFFQWGTVLASKAAKKNNVPFIIWQEMDINPQFPGDILQTTYNRTYGRLVSRRTSAFVPRSESARRYLLSLGISPDIIAPIIHTGVDTEVFHPLEDGDLKERFGVRPESPLILSVGRLHPNKGFDILIEALSDVREKIPNVSLAIKGSGPQKAQLERLIDRLGLRANVRIITEHLSRKRMNELYNASDFIAISSRIDLFPFSAMESLACAKPVVSTYGRAVAHDIIGEHGTGILVSDGSRRGFVDAMVHLIRNPKIRHEMGRRALNLCHQQFDLNVVSGQFCDIYNEVASQGSST